MVAFLIFNDGVIMALDFAAILGGVLFGLDQQQLILLMILVQVTNVAGAYAFGYLVDRIRGKTALTISILVMVADVVWLYFSQTAFEYFLIGAVAGFAMAGIQSVSRTLVGLFSPPGRSAEFYGFFAMTGRTSSFIGPAVFGWLAAEGALFFQRQGQTLAASEVAGHRMAVLSIAAFLLIGLALVTFVDEEKARAAATEAIPDLNAAATESAA